jgi:hypothetical protein
VAEPQSTASIDLDRLEAMRADVVAHVSTLSPEKRRTLRAAFDATVERIDAEIARRTAAAQEQQPPAPAR